MQQDLAAFVYVPAGSRLEARLMLTDGRGRQVWGPWWPASGGAWTQVTMPDARVDPAYKIQKVSVQFVAPAGAANYTGPVWVDHVLVKGVTDHLTDATPKTAAAFAYDWTGKQTRATGPNAAGVTTTTTYTYDDTGYATAINPPSSEDFGFITTSPVDPDTGQPIEPVPPEQDIAPPSGEAVKAPGGYFSEQPQEQVAATGTSRYNGAAAANYAVYWTYRYNRNYLVLDTCQDCTNFASQSLRAGGWKNQGVSCGKFCPDSWYYFTQGDPAYSTSHYWSRNWYAADHMAVFLDRIPARARLRRSASWVDRGDVISVDFDRNNIDGGEDMRKTHTLVVTWVDAHHPNNIYVRYHSAAGYQGKAAKLGDFLRAARRSYGDWPWIWAWDVYGSG